MSLLLSEDIYRLPTPMPRGVRKAVLDKPNAKVGVGGKKPDFDTFSKIEVLTQPDSIFGDTEKYVVFTQPPEPVVSLAEANIITSLLPWKVKGENAHAPVLDLDFEHEYIPADGSSPAVISIGNTLPLASPNALAKTNVNALMASYGDLRIGHDEIEIPCPHLYLASSTPGHAHLYLDIVMPESKFFFLLSALKDLGLIETGYCDASKHRGYSAVRCPWVKKTPMDIEKKQHYQEVLAEISEAELKESNFLKAVQEHGYPSAYEAATELGMTLWKEHYLTVGLQNHWTTTSWEPSHVDALNFGMHLKTLKMQADQKKKAKKTGVKKHKQPSFVLLPDSSTLSLKKFADGGLVPGGAQVVGSDALLTFKPDPDSKDDEKINSSWLDEKKFKIQMKIDEASFENFKEVLEGTSKSFDDLASTTKGAKSVWKGLWSDAPPVSDKFVFAGPIKNHAIFSDAWNESQVAITGEIALKVYGYQTPDAWSEVQMFLPEFSFQVTDSSTHASMVLNAKPCKNFPHDTTGLWFNYMSGEFIFFYVVDGDFKYQVVGNLQQGQFVHV